MRFKTPAERVCGGVNEERAQSVAARGRTARRQGGAHANITLTDNGAAGVNYESFVAKYDAGGNLLWAKGGNSGSPKNADNLETGQNGIEQIVFDAGGNPYIAGFVSGNHFSGSFFTNQGQSGIILAKLNPANGADKCVRILSI